MNYILFFLSFWCTRTDDFTSMVAVQQSEAEVYQAPDHGIHEYPYVDVADLTLEVDFGTNMNAILEGFPSHFVNLKSDPWVENDTARVLRFQSHIWLSKSVQSYVEEGSSPDKNSFYATFSDSNVPEYTLQSYKQLNYNFKYTYFSCGSFTPEPERIDGYRRSQVYKIKIAEDISNLAYQNLQVEIGIDQAIENGGTGVFTVWIPFVKVYGM